METFICGINERFPGFFFFFFFALFCFVFLAGKSGHIFPVAVYNLSFIIALSFNATLWNSIKVSIPNFKMRVECKDDFPLFP